MSNKFNPKKLMHAKWTSVEPQNKEKHFMVVKLYWDEDHQQVVKCDLEAVINGRIYHMDPQQLKDTTHWQIGWK